MRRVGDFHVTELLASPRDDLSRARVDLAWLWERRGEEQEAVWGEFVVRFLAGVMATLSNLRSIELDAVVTMCHEEKAARQGRLREVLKPVITFAHQVVVSAIVTSGASIEVFAGYHQMPKCSVPAGDIATLVRTFQADKLAAAGRSIKTLRLSIAIMPNISTVRAVQHNLGSLTAADVDAICGLLVAMPNLEELDLHIPDAKRVDSGAQESLSLFRAVAERIQLQSLQRCALRGIVADEKSLRQFLGNHSSITRWNLTRSDFTRETGRLYSHNLVAFRA